MSIQHPMPRPRRFGPRPRGRPIQAAIIPFDSTAKLRVLQDFNTAIKALTWQEVTGLAYTLNRHRDTVARWKYGNQVPNAWTMLEVIDWVRQGKPSRPVIPRENRKPM